jgi:hypothetical protein
MGFNDDYLTWFPAVFWQTEPELRVFLSMIQSGRFTGFLGMDE